MFRISWIVHLSQHLKPFRMRSPLFIVCFLCLSLCSHAGPGPNDEEKNIDSKRWKKGFIVTLTGDTVQGKIKTLDFLDVYYDYQSQLSFQDNKGIIQYTPYELISFTFYETRDSLVTMQSVSSPDGDGHLFLRLYYTGSCKVYGFVISEIKVGNMGPGQGEGQIHSSLFHSERKYIQLAGSQFFSLRRIGFKKSMKEIFASCPNIVSRLESKQYTYDSTNTTRNHQLPS